MTLVVSIDGLPADAIYQAAARRPDGDGWDLGDSVAAPRDSSQVDVAITVGETDSTAQVAILVYLATTPAAPGRVTTLYESGAQLAFVTN